MNAKTQRAWMEIVTGRRTGIVAAALRAFYSAVSMLYAGALWLRAGAFALGLRRRHRLPGPVIGVGNITLGGTGKSPMVEMLTRRLEARGLKVAIVSRGYGREVSGVDDEAFAGGIRLTGGDRLDLARAAFNRLSADVVILDDGFHDLRIRRDFDIAMVDASAPDGNGRLFPRGFLRERPRGLSRADLIVVSRADMVSTEELALLRAHLAAVSGGRPVATSVHRPRPPRALHGPPAPDSLAERTILGFCGIGNPLGFESTLKRLGAAVSAFRAFPDHHPFSDIELDGLEAEARELEVEALVTTSKDAARLKDRPWTVPVWILDIDLEIVQGASEIEAGLEKVCSRAGRRVGAPQGQGPA